MAGQIQDTEARQRVEREAIRVFTAWRGIVHSRLLDPITPEEQLAWLVAVHDWAIPNGLAGQPLVSTGFENVRCTVAHKAFMDAVEYLTLKDIRRLSGWEPVQLEIASLTDEVRKLNETIVERNELARTSIISEAGKAGSSGAEKPGGDATAEGEKAPTAESQRGADQWLRLVSAGNSGSDETGSSNRPHEILTKEALACAALVDHPDWTDDQIAKAAGCNRKSLYRMRRFRQAKELLKQSRKEAAPAGWKDSETGNMDAWDNLDE